MRLLTINIHSHGSDFEPELYHQKMKALAAFIKEEEIDAAAIQECSEEEDRPVVSRSNATNSSVSGTSFAP